MRVVCFFDGGCLHGVRAAGAAIVYDEHGQELARRARYMEGPDVTVNISEYQGLLTALELAREVGATHVKVLGDSELICRHFSGRYQCRKAHLQPWLARVREAAERFDECAVQEIPKSGKDRRRRNGNSAADALSTQCMRAGRDLP